MKTYTVYMHISPNDKRYIGITSQKLEERWRNGNAYKENSYFTNAIKKYKWDNFQHIIIAKGLTNEEACWLEMELIREWDTTNRDKGYNITLGGEGRKGIKHTEETKRKISKNSRKNQTEKTKRRISKTMKGQRCGKNNNNAKSVICLTTKRIFYTITDGARYYKCRKQNIVDCCRKQRIKSAGKLPDGTKLVWRYIKWNHNKKFRIKK